MRKRSKIIFITFYFFYIINYCQCSPKFGIIGGQETTITKFPHQCAFLANSKLKCGCSIISSKCLLTAAHCTSQFNKNISVRVGSTWKEQGGSVYGITKIIEYPLFDMPSLNYDYSLLIPDRDIKFDFVSVRPIGLPEQNQEIDENTLCVVSGWGKAENNTRPDKLRSVDVRVINQKVCQDAYDTPRVKFRITDRMMCAGYMEGGMDACSGDSLYAGYGQLVLLGYDSKSFPMNPQGGPLICYVNNQWMQYGVVSSGYGCALKNFPGIYANIAKVRNWIDLYCNT